MPSTLSALQVSLRLRVAELARAPDGIAEPPVRTEAVLPITPDEEQPRGSQSQNGGLSHLTAARPRPYLAAAGAPESYGPPRLQLEHAKSSDSDAYTPPAELTALLTASDTASCDAAWTELVAKHSRLLLHTIHSRCDSYDKAMDRYTFILEKLRENDYARLRRYAADGRGEFSTWLVVVCRRLSEDYRRTLYGRATSSTTGGAAKPSGSSELRSRLVDLVGVKKDIASFPEPQGGDPEINLRQRQLHSVLDEALRELDPADRLLLQYRFEYELTAKEIAKIMKLPTPFHVYRRVTSRLRRLRRHLRDRGFSEAEP